MKKQNVKVNDDQLQEYITEIRKAHEKVEFSVKLVAKHGKESIEAALRCGKYLLAAEKLIKGRMPWIKWCNKTFAKVSYRTLSRYRGLYENWTELSKKDRDQCETLNQAYLLAKITSESGSNKKPTTPDAQKYNEECLAELSKLSTDTDSTEHLTFKDRSDLIGDHVSRVMEIIDCTDLDKESKAIETIAKMLAPIVKWYSLHIQGYSINE